MDDAFLEQTKTDILDFATDKRSQWEARHQLYSVIFEITPRCNLSCVHCYLHDHHAAEELSYEEIIDIIDILYENEVLFLTLTGGEIFTRKDFPSIYLYAKRKGFIIELYTNGILIDKRMVDLFKEYPPLLVDISLYGSCDETYTKVTGVHGAFDKVLGNISRLVEAGIRVSLKAPVLNLYYDELPEMEAIASRFGVPFRTGFEIFPTIGKDKAVQDYAVSAEQNLRYEFEKARHIGKVAYHEIDSDTEFINLAEERPLFRCKLGRASCSIDYEGRMCPCMSFRHVGTRLTHENFSEVWHSFSRYPKRRASESYPCLSCEAYDFCDICPAMMEFLFGDLEHVDTHFCELAKKRYQHYIEHKDMPELFPLYT